MRTLVSLAALALAPGMALADAHSSATPVEYGPRPAYLVDKLPEGDLKQMYTAWIFRDFKHEQARWLGEKAPEEVRTHIDAEYALCFEGKQTVKEAMENAKAKIDPLLK